MTVRAFGSQADFVIKLTSLPTPDGGVFCTSYLPSAIFPKSAIASFYGDRQRYEGSDAGVDQLWAHGRRLFSYLSSGRCRLILEASALTSFVNEGIVHTAVPNYEVNHSVRMEVLAKLAQLASDTDIVVTTEPIPFVFRLVPPRGVLIDVAHNTIDQLVQGLWVDDASVYDQFQSEAERLTNVEGALSGGALVVRLLEAVKQLESGRLPFWG